MAVKWTTDDFDVFNIPGLEQRMEALTEHVRPKFEELAKTYTTYFTSKTGIEFYPHIARHARRKVNPPIDSWVAFAPNKRGYKALPHFEIGLFESHVFIILCAIYEAPTKKAIADNLLNNLETVKALPHSFFVTGDHFDPKGTSLNEAIADGTLEKLLIRLKEVKKGEFLIGLQIPREEAIQLSGEEFEEKTEETLEELMPIYRLMASADLT
ncbi:YktB family protein [Rummeliibacillus stabekisii]|uniref:YktB family protein n=1 Tax=Rummeliibacillus stabekisii TaxID=241244 RepID=UPI00116AA891|nr:DUF1054 domain-containing protein [Rummeliibacillus stabekisii]MBB5170015.1 uncharacterized protein YktB (UPF0637 family) [Rummeliibacillus stabekisii]GEL04273.1 UPF0637 protein YktB [Rummeliibacillus stabekisii]